MPPRPAKIVIHLRRTCQTKNESWSVLEKLLHLSIEGVATDDLIVGFKEGAVLRVEFADHRPATLGIPLPENLQHVPFHKLAWRGIHKNLLSTAPNNYALDYCE
jgi:hypothetical protein